MIIVGPKLEDDLNFFANGSRPQFFGKWKTTSLFWKMEDDLNLKEIGTQLKRKWKTNLILKYTEDGHR